MRMKVQSVNNYNQAFGMAIKATPEAKKIIADNLTENAAKKVKELQAVAQKDIVDVNIRTEQFPIRLRSPEIKYSQLVIDVGDGSKHSYRPDSNSWLIVNAIRRAVKQAHKLSEKQKAVDDIGL